jgi:hypothetical protein
VWLADLTYTQQGVSAETMPQAVGGLATYAATRMDLEHRVRVFKYPEKLARALEDEAWPDVVGFSNYVWNSNLSRAFAASIKQRSPGTLVVFGGPHYPLLTAEQERFLRERLGPAVDFYVEGEGEHAFAELLLALASGGTGAVHGRIPGVHSIDSTGRAHLPAPGARLPDLRAVPSPYLAGLMEEFFDGHLVPTVQTNRGCPFSCTFCVEGTRYFAKVAKKLTERVAAELHYIGARMAPLVAERRARNELLITDSNFGMFPEDMHTCRVIADCQDAYGWPRYVNVTTGKNKRDRVLAAVSLVNGAINLSGAVQSLDPDVLAKVRRANIDAGQLMEVALAASKRQTGTYSEVILGLPRDSKRRHFHSLEQLIAAGFGRINMFQLSLLPGSELCNDAARDEHGMTTRFRVMPRCFGSYELPGGRVTTAEVDEVCVALPDLPYDDYRQCRRMNLFVAACYNDGALSMLVRLLRLHGVSVFRWLELMHGLPAGPRLARVLEEFLDATDEQLWQDREGLLEFAAANIDRYVGGELGNNLLYTYRARMLTDGLDDLADLAARACRAACAEAGLTDPFVTACVDEAAEYHRLRLADVLTGRARVELEQPARFDLDALNRSSGTGQARQFLLSRPATRRFSLAAEQVALVEGYLDKFGNTPGGAGRLLSKVRLTDLTRQARLVGDDEERRDSCGSSRLTRQRKASPETYGP